VTLARALRRNSLSHDLRVVWMRNVPHRYMTTTDASTAFAASWRASLDTAQQWVRTVPFATRTIVLACTVCTLLCRHGLACFGTYLFGASSRSSYFNILWAFCMSPLVHQGLLHWVFNMLTWVSIATPMELGIGSSSLIGLAAAFAFFNNLLFLLAEVIVTSWVPATCVIGLSGVLFSLMTFDAWGGGRCVAGGVSSPSSSDSTTLVCGLIPVKTKYAPFAVLIMMLLLFPGSSFVMHLTGILTGLIAATMSQTKQFLNFTADWGRESCCSRSRYFEDAPAEVGRSQSEASSSPSSFPTLPFVGPPKGFEAFQGSGRRLGGISSNPSPALPPGADVV
jgi:membrane associated rhomboid family serine protease